MRRDLVEARGWYSEDEYQQGLAIAQTMPGPLAAQLAMWLGYLERGARGALLVALPFVLPPFLIVTAVAALYAHYQGLSQPTSSLAPPTSTIRCSGRSPRSSAHRRSSPAARSSGCSLPLLCSAPSTTAAAFHGYAAALPPCRHCRWRRSRASSGSPPAAHSERWAFSSPRRARSRSAPGWRSCRSCTRAWSQTTTG